MNDLQPLKTLLEQAERERDAALAEHQRVLAASRAAQAQSEELLTYRREYEKRWTEQFKTEGKMELVRCYHEFMNRLTSAVEGQARAVQQAAAHADRAGNALRQQEIRCASVRKLIERRVHGLRADEERRDQKQSDEFASRLAWGRANASDQTPAV
ncbi:N/A [soil metagenome]